MRSTVVVAGLAIAILGCSGGVSEPSSSSSLAAPSETVEPSLSPAPCAEPARYTPTPMGAVVVDTTNNLLWQRDVAPIQRTQIQSYEYCASLDLEQHVGWRVPDVAELTSLRLRPGLTKDGPDSCNPAIDQSAFPATPPAEFWTSEQTSDGAGRYTDFGDGRTHPAEITTPFYVRCVHEPLEHPSDPTATAR